MSGVTHERPSGGEPRGGRPVRHFDSLPLVKRYRLLLELAAGRSRLGHLPVWRQLAEMAVLWAFYGIGPGYYQAAGFWQKDIAWRSKTAHLGSRAYRRFLDGANPAAYRKISQHKLSEKGLLQLFGIPSARFLGLLDATHGSTTDGQPLRNAADLARLLGSLRGRRICFKLTEGWGGAGFAAAEVVAEAESVRLCPLLQDRALEVQEFCDSVLAFRPGASRVIEEYIQQHPVLAALNPSSLNTGRLWVWRGEGRPVEVVGAFFRLGRAGSIVDNTSRGGLVAPMDCETGVLMEANDGQPTRKVFRTHPDHGAAIEGVKIPFWNETRELACRTLSVFPNMRFAGMDVAISADGPMIVELNVEPDKIGQKSCRRGVREFA